MSGLFMPDKVRFNLALASQIKNFTDSFFFALGKFQTEFSIHKGWLELPGIDSFG
jgi:hypothetical protein